MKINVPSENKAELISWLAGSEDEIYIFSPYVQESAVAMIVKNSPKSVSRINLLIRAEPQDFLTGATSIQAIELAMNFNWKVKYNTSLHAKVFWQNNGRIFFGSANLTGRGLSSNFRGNYELTGSSPSCSADVLQSLNNFWSKSIELSENDLLLLENFKANSVVMTPKISNFPLTKPESGGRRFSLLDIPQSDTLATIHEKLSSENPSLSWDDSFLHDLELLQLDANSSKNDVYKAFLNLPLTTALLSEIGEGKFFGELRRWLIDHIEDTPTPSRQTFNEQLNRMYNLIVEGSRGNYIKKRPNYSEGIFKIK